MLGRLGSILDEYGYLKDADFGRNEVWLEKDSYYPHKPRPYYPYNIVWSKEMKDIIAEYSSAYKKGMTLRNEINTLIKEKKETGAKGLWDSV